MKLSLHVIEIIIDQLIFYIEDLLKCYFLRNVEITFTDHVHQDFR